MKSREIKSRQLIVGEERKAFRGWRISSTNADKDIQVEKSKRCHMLLIIQGWVGKG